MAGLFDCAALRMTGVSLALWLLENWDGLPRFPGPCHRLRSDFADSALDRSDRYQRMVGVRSFSPVRPPYSSGSIIPNNRAIRIFFVLPPSYAFLALSS